MRSMQSLEAGGPDSLVLTEIAEPQPGPDEVRIAVRACGINYPDALFIADRYQIKPPRPFAPGGEIAGEIDAVGTDVAGFKPGDRVAAMCGLGGLAEKIVLPAASIVPVPAAMPFDDAAVFIAAYGTAYHGLNDRAALKAGETLLVLGAAGGVGLAAVELGRAMGARVIVGVSTQAKLDLALSRGAAGGFLYPIDIAVGDRALGAAIKEACGANGADVVCDVVGGPLADLALRAMAWSGRYLVIGFAAGIPSVPLNLPLLKGSAIVGVLYGVFSQKDPDAARRGLDDVLAFYQAGKIKPYISARYPLEHAGQAIAELAERRALGKIVVTIDTVL